LLSGGLLLVDCSLAVAVSTTSGVEAITSAVPALYKFSIPIGIVIVLLIMFMNLRGMSESANFLTIPVYFFVIMMIVMVVWGGYNIASGHIHYWALVVCVTPYSG